MCRMIGFSFEDDTSINELFKMLQDMAKNGIKSPHKHGFGIYAENKNKEILYHKFEEPIYELNVDFPKFKLGIMHARKASPNFPIGYLQIHPFFDEYGNAFCHNGTIYTTPRNNIFKSDSYDYFLKIRDFNSIEKLAKKLKDFINTNDFSGINFLLIKKHKLYAFCYFKSEPEYYTMWYSDNIVSSEALGTHFKKVKKGELLIFENGKLSFKECII
ncbi:class II glutamine amidotransferase [Thermosipho atlanticus]|uniref:Glutamine amidotransferase n=1 Tax=Thermosipho atlanticus DSM 15807 TaxID=1123380 RepID=A0A1M5SG81_9BACT|nr:hypothetical protein [Thermosipho atlanticus]SHH37298.1 glutamine amidotransferase [Thermosipho atlanticus DSM 15807]